MSEADTTAPSALDLVSTPVPPIPEARKTIGSTSPGDLTDIVARAKEAQIAWGDLPVSARIRAIKPVKNRILARASEIAELLREECGKPIEEGLAAEVLPNADLVIHWTSEIEALLEPEDVSLDPLAFPAKSGRTFREPRGVIALITPWNFPIAIPLRTIVPALLAGNAVVFKPSEISPRAGALLVSLFDGLVPYGVLSIVQGAGEVGAALTASDVDLVVFTGSVATGRRIAEACAKRLVPCSLELGGKDAAIVLADANLERAARGVVWGALNNAGQNCASIERIYVESVIAEPFIKRVTELVNELRQGVDLGRMTTTAQLSIVRKHVTRALEDGAELLAGGTSDDASMVHAPTVLRVTRDDSDVMREETFGPVLPIVVVASAEEAIARANQSRFGLTASLWTRNLSRAEDLARKLRAGVVTINNSSFTAAIAGAPWSGVGESGSGITSSPHALAELTRPRFVLTDANRAKRELWWYPYTPNLRTVLESMAIARGGGGFFARLKAPFRLIPAMLRRLFGG